MNGEGVKTWDRGLEPALPGAALSLQRDAGDTGCPSSGLGSGHRALPTPNQSSRLLCAAGSPQAAATSLFIFNGLLISREQWPDAENKVLPRRLAAPRAGCSAGGEGAAGRGTPAAARLLEAIRAPGSAELPVHAGAAS